MSSLFAMREIGFLQTLSTLKKGSTVVHHLQDSTLLVLLLECERQI